MPIRTIQDLRRQAGGQWQDKTDEDLISAYADFVQADPVEVANTLGYKPSEAGVTGQRFGAALDRYQAGFYGLGEAVTGGLGFTGAQESLAERRRANEFEAAVASRAARELGGIESYKDVRGIGDVPSYIGGLAIGSSPYIAEAAVGGLAARGLMSGTKATLGAAAQTGDVAAAQAARQTLRRGMTVGGAAATYPSSVGEILQAQREQADTTDLGAAAALGVPFAALNVMGVEGAAARLGAFRSVGEGLDALKGFRGGLTRAGVTGLRVGATESLSETGQEAISQVGRMGVDPSEEFLSPDARERFTEAAIGGFALGKTFGTLGGGWRRSVEPLDLTKDAQGDLNQGIDTSRINVQPGAGLSTQDLINQITGVTRPEGERPTRQSMEAALNEQTGQMVPGPGGIERPQTAGDVYGVPSAPARAAQPAAQQTQGAQPPQAQAPQIDPAVAQQVAQAYGVQQVPPGPGVPTQAFTIAGKTVMGVPRVNQIVSEIAQANQNKDPERVQLESAIVASGIPFGGQPSAKGILGGIDGVIKKYQLDGAATLNDAANILEFQIGQGKSPKSVEPLARIYEALTGQMSPAFQRLTEGPTPAAGTAPLTPPASLGLMQPTGAPSGQPTPRAAAPAPAATTAAPAATTAPAPTPATVQAQPVRAAQPVSAAPSPRTEEVTAGAQAWEDMNVSTVQYSDLTEQDRADWDQAVAEGRATGEAQEQLAKEYELIQEQGFMQQVLDRIIGRVIKSPNKARYYSTFLAAGAKQQDIIAKATENAERDADGNLTEKAQAQIKALSQELSALRGAPNPELAAEYGVALDTLKEWNQGLRTFLTDKATQLQEAARVVAVELRLEGGDLRNVLSQMVVRHQQATADFQTATQLEQAVFDETVLADPESGMAVLEGRTAASVQEVYNASETVNARFLRLQQELVDAENDGNQELADEITAKLDALTEDAAKQATKQAGKRPAREKKDAVPKREAKETKTQYRVTYDGKPATVTIIRMKDDPTKIDDVTIKIDGEQFAAVSFGKQGAVTDAKMLNNLIEIEAIDAKGEPDAVPKRETEKVSVQPRAKAGEKVGQKVRVAKEPAREAQAQKEEVKTTAVADVSKFGRLQEYLNRFKPLSTQNFQMVGSGQLTAIRKNSEFKTLENVTDGEIQGKYEVRDLPNSEIKRHTLVLMGRGRNNEVFQMDFDLGTTSSEPHSLKQRRSVDGDTLMVHYPGDLESGNLIFNIFGSPRAIEARKSTQVTTPDVPGVAVALRPKDPDFPKSTINTFSFEAQGARAQLHNDPARNSNTWKLGLLTAKDPGQGAGSKLLNSITTWADKNNLTLTVVAAADTQSGKKLSQEELVKFYEKRGFEPDAQSRERIEAGVSYSGLVRYPNAITTGTTKAPSTQTTQAAAVLTVQEAAEVKYNELRQLVGDALPTWDKLSDAQRAALVEIDPAQMNMRDLQRIVDDSRTTDVEAREVSGTERQLLLEQTNKLNDSQVKLLENEYGAKVGTDSFVKQLSTDVSNYVNKGAEFVSAKIRAVIKAIASGVLAIGVVFNPNVQLNNFSFDLPSTYASSKTVITEVPADAAPRMSALAQSVYVQMANAAQKSGKGFIIADKPNGMIHLFNADGSLLAQDTALYGKDVGDSIAGQKAALEGGPKVTPAGQFELGIMPSNDYTGGFGLTLQGTNQPLTSPENLAKKRFNSTVAVHAAYLGDVNERRLDRLASPSAKDKRISYGCINTSHDLFLNKIKPNAKSFDGGMIFVLPDNPQFLAERGQLPTPPAPKTPAKNAMRRRAEKHVQELTDTDQSLMLEDASLDEMTQAYEGVSALRNRYDSLGLSNVFNAVGQFFVSYNTNVDWDGIITNIDNQVSVVLRRDIAAQKGASLWTMGHELGHAVDRVIQGDDVYSSDQRLNLRKTKDRVIPMGEVAVEMANLRKKNDAINTVLGYPYDFNEVSDLTTQKVRQELFAQIWALYTTNDVTRDIIDQQAPKTSAFMKEVLADVQTTENFNATNLTGPAFDSRKEGFPQRRDRPDESVGTAAQVAAAQQNLPVARSRNAQAAVNAIDGIPPTVKAASNVILQTLRNWTRKGVDRVVFTEALINRAVESGIRSAAEFKQLMQARGVETRKFEKEVERIADMYALVPDKDRGTGSQSVNAFIYDSTRTKKWGFPPKWRSTGVDIDEDLKIRFYALSSEAQSFIRAVFKHGDDTLALKKKILMDYTNSEYDAQIKAAQVDGNAQLVAELQKEKVADLKKFDTLFKLREGIPYAPLKRIGKYAVVAKSPEYRAAEDVDDKKRIRELEQDPNHYQVSFVDSDIQARNLQKQLQDQGFYGTNEDAVYYFEREKFQDELYGGDTMLAALSKLRATVERTGQDEKSTNQLRKIITDMYLHALADSSARKSELRRRAVPGEIDMLQSFALQGRADANFLAAVQYNNRTQEALQKMRKQARQGGNRTRKSELLNELNGRYIQSLEYEPNQIVQKLNRITSVYFLASSPGYYLQNATQPWMMSLPVMAGRHDYIKSANAIYNAYFDLKDVMKSAKLFDQQFDFSKVPDDVKDVIETLVNRSQIDIGISTEMGEFTIEGQGPVTDTWNKVDKGMRLAVQKVEAINRLTTAIAAYRLELAKTGNRDLAVDYASSIINDTHGDYSAFNAPRMFNTNVGKVALQFRKFQLIQLGLIAKLFKNSFTKGPEQQVAIKALGYILGQTAILTGVMGMPGAAFFAWAAEGIYGFFDEEEPLDIKGKIRDAIGNDDISNIILYGSPNLAGVNLSGKIGMGNALSVMPFTDIKNLNGEKTYQIIGTLLGGPAGGMAARMADGMSYIAAGDEYKGLELMLPKGLGDAMRSVRVYSEGLTSRRGDVLLSPDQIGEVTAFWQSLGLTPTQTSVRGEKQGRVIELEQQFSSRSSTLKRQYSEAAKDQDRTKQAELRRQWLDLQAARVRNGYPRKPMTELTTAPQEQRKREQQTSEGVPFTDSSRRFVERITE